MQFILQHEFGHVIQEMRDPGRYKKEFNQFLVADMIDSLSIASLPITFHAAPVLFFLNLGVTTGARVITFRLKRNKSNAEKEAEGFASTTNDVEFRSPFQYEIEE